MKAKDWLALNPDLIEKPTKPAATPVQPQITTIPLDQFPPCCGTCRYYEQMTTDDYCTREQRKSARLWPIVRFNNHCERHEPRESSDGRQT